MYAGLKVAAEGLGILSMLNDLGWHLRGEVWGDASAALGIINRRGLGKTRHIHTGHLWIQEIVARERLKFKKVLGRDNPADLYTKFLDERTSLHHTTTLACRSPGGRAEEAPQLHVMSRSRDDYPYGPNGYVIGRRRSYTTSNRHGAKGRGLTTTVRGKSGHTNKVEKLQTRESDVKKGT